MIGTIPWVVALAFAGHALGGDWTSVRKGFEYVDYAIVVLVVIADRLRGDRAGAWPHDAGDPAPDVDSTHRRGADRAP